LARSLTPRRALTYASSDSVLSVNYAVRILLRPRPPQMRRPRNRRHKCPQLCRQIVEKECHRPQRCGNGEKDQQIILGSQESPQCFQLARRNCARCHVILVPLVKHKFDEKVSTRVTNSTYRASCRIRSAGCLIHCPHVTLAPLAYPTNTCPSRNLTPHQPVR
jgi:hypothetical protein